MNNTMAPRTILAIAVGQQHNSTETCEFFTLGTHKYVKTDHLKRVPLTEEVI